MKSLLTIGLALAVSFVASTPAEAFRPGGGGTFGHRPMPRPPQSQPAAFAGLAALDSSTCQALEKIMTSPEVIKNFKAARKQGASLTKITPLPRRSSDEQTVTFTFDKVGNPFQPPSMAIPYHASFSVQMFLPQDAGWQMGEVGPLNEVH